MEVPGKKTLPLIAKPSARQIEIAKQRIEMIAQIKAKYEPYVGKVYKPNEQTLNNEIFQIHSLVPLLPMGIKGVKSVFRLKRLDRMGAKFAVCEEFLANHTEIPQEAGENPIPGPHPEVEPPAPQPPPAQ